MNESTHKARLLLARSRNVGRLAANLLDTPAVVLCYHRVATKSGDQNSIAVSAGNFCAQMEHLKKRYRLARFEESWDHKGKPTAVVTFDDGYADFVTGALPVLERMGIPVTLFVSTGLVGSDAEFWWDALERMVMGEGDRPATFALEDPQFDRTWRSATGEDRRAMYRDLHRAFMGCGPQKRDAWLSLLGAWAGDARAADGTDRLLTGDELLALADNPLVTIGAHTRTHPQLSSLDGEAQRREIAGSKHDLEKLLGKEVTVFAYPFGKKTDYDRQSARLCREAGFLKAAAAFPGEAHRWTDPFQVPRHFVYDWDGDAFAFRLKRLWLR